MPLTACSVHSMQSHRTHQNDHEKLNVHAVKLNFIDAKQIQCIDYVSLSDISVELISTIGSSLS